MKSSSEARFGEYRATDPTFEEVLADPMIRLLMKQDHVHVDEARRLFTDTARRIRATRAKVTVSVSRRERDTALSA
ncbi:MAG: hypothetical protein U1E62_11030 [Alsobacter sp.]